MDCTVRRQPNGGQLSFSLPHQAFNPTIYPVTAIDGSTIVLYGHENGLNTLRLYESGKPDLSKWGSQEFDEEEDDIHPRLEQWIEIGTDSPVTRIAIPSFKSNPTQTPDFLRNNLLVVVACADTSIRFITFPLNLDPHGKRHDVKVTTLNNPACHQDLIASVALFWTLDEDQDDQNKTRSRSRTDHLHFLIASASTTGGGLLAIHGLSLTSHLTGHGENDSVLVKQFVSSPLLGSTLAFNHATAKSAKPTLLLLTSPAHGLVSILALDDLSSSLKRRGEDTAKITDSAAVGFQLRMVLSLYAPYHSTTIPASRKAILDAKWIARGTGIVAMFEDSQWGIWDFENADRKSTRLSNDAKAGALNSFKVLGNLSTNSQSKKGTGRPSVDTIAPVTPHTRKIRSAALFGNETASSDTRLRHGRPSGRITLCDEQTANDTDDALILSYDENNMYLPTLKPYLDTSRAGDIGGGRSYEKRLQTLPSIRLGGERQLCLCNRSVTSKRNPLELLGAMNTKPDLLVVTDSRLILYNNTNHKSTLDSSALKLPLRSLDSREMSFMSRMASGDILDVDAMDQILESMEQTESNDNVLSPSRGNPTTMQVDEQLHSPSRRMSPGSKLTIDGQRSTSRRKLFG